MGTEELLSITKHSFLPKVLLVECVELYSSSQEQSVFFVTVSRKYACTEVPSKINKNVEYY
jgi:hypothetical protein